METKKSTSSRVVIKVGLDTIRTESINAVVGPYKRENNIRPYWFRVWCNAGVSFDYTYETERECILEMNRVSNDWLRFLGVTSKRPRIAEFK